MSKATRDWGWKMMHKGHERHWPYAITRVLNDIGNYGLRGTVRERVVRGAWFWFRNNFYWRFGLHKIPARLRARRGLPYHPDELRYAQRGRCRCGAGLAYWPPGFFLRPAPDESVGWVCADVLTGEVSPEGTGDTLLNSLGKVPRGVKHDYYPFNFYEIRSEDQPNRQGVKRKVLWGLLGERPATCREIGDSTRFIKGG